LLVVELAVLAGIAVAACAVGEAQALRPDAAIDDADDDALTLGLGGPDAARAGQAEEGGRARRVERARFVLGDAEHAGGQRQLGCLRLGQFGSKAVEHVAVVVELLAAAHAIEQAVLARRQVAHVAHDLRVVRVDLLAFARLGRSVSLDAAVVDGHRRLGELHDVGVVLERRLVGVCRQGRRCQRRQAGSRQHQTAQARFQLHVG
jgi:hypothetical protein